MMRSVDRARITMHPPHFTISSLLFLVAAFGVGFASLRGDHLWFSGLSLLTTLSLVISAIGASSDSGRRRPSSTGSW
jgi:hypothetical protein